MNWRHPAPFLIIGHRGAHAHAPENTLAGLEAGIRLGADALEFDVQLHPSGAVFLLHDLRLERTTGGHGRAADHPWPALAQLGISTLDEALDHVGHRALVNIELKTWNGTAAAVAGILSGRLARGWPADGFLVSSFHLPELAEFRRRLPQVPIGALYDGLPLKDFDDAKALGAEYVNLNWEFADEATLARAAAGGHRALLYTVNDAQEARRWKHAGAAGVFTDDPERIRAAI